MDLNQLSFLNLNQLPPQLSAIMATLAGSGLGLVYFNFGRHQSDWFLAASGIALMSYSLFVSALPWLVLIGATLAFLPFLFKRSR